MSALVGRPGRHLLVYGGALVLAVALGAAVAYAQGFVGDSGPYLLVGALLTAVVAMAILLEWRLGVLVLVAVLPYQNVINTGPTASGSKVVALLMFFSLALALMRERGLAERLLRLWRQPLMLAVFALSLWALTSVLWASDEGSALVKTSTFVGMVGLMTVIGLLEEGYLRLLWAVAALSAVFSVPAAYILPQSGKMAEVGRLGTGGADPNAFAAALVMIFLVAFFGFTRYRTAVYILAPVLLYGIFATQSRTALIALAAAPAMSLLIPRVAARMGGRALLLYGLGTAAFVGIALLIPAFGEILVQRYETLSQYQSEDTWSGRWSIWQGAFHVIASHPVLGVGAGNFGEVAANYSTRIFEGQVGGRGGVAHNVFLSVAAELGVVGLALFLGVLFLAFRTVLPLCRSTALAAGIFFGLVAYAIAGLTLTLETEKLAYALYGSILALHLQREPQAMPKSRGKDLP